MASENIVKLIDAVSQDEEQMAALEQELMTAAEKGPGGQAKAINFEETIKSLADKYGIAINEDDIKDMKGMLGNFNKLSQADALSLNNGAPGGGADEDPGKGLLSSLLGGGANSLFGNSGSLYNGANSGQNVTLTQNQLQQLLNNASNNASLNNSSALGGLSSLLGGSGAASLLGGGGSLLGTGASMLSKLFLLYLFMKMVSGGASLIL